VLGGVAGVSLVRAFAAIPVAEGAVIAGYWPMGDEADVRPLLEALAQQGHILALPVVARKDAPLIFRRWAPGQDLEAGPHRTAHPNASAPDIVPDVLLVPLLAFDGRGGRLGYGGGYYDRTLDGYRRTGRKILAVGVAFAAQQRPDVPVDDHDQRLDWVITEQGALEMSV